MTEQLLALAVVWGLPFLALAVGMTCLGIPMPSALLMLAAGSLAAAGEFSLPAVFAVSLIAAIAGDQLGYWIGRWIGALVLGRLGASGGAAAVVDRARNVFTRSSIWSVFFTRWLLSTLGPYVNLIAGATGMSWLHFSLAGVAGESVWVGLYVGLGAGFSAYIPQIADIASSAGVFLGAVVVAAILGRYLWTAAKAYGRAGSHAGIKGAQS
jgi:membrane protein DedA with SNARE-associated domain